MGYLDNYFGNERLGFAYGITSDIDAERRYNEYVRMCAEKAEARRKKEAEEKEKREKAELRKYIEEYNASVREQKERSENYQTKSRDDEFWDKVLESRDRERGDKYMGDCFVKKPTYWDSDL